MTIGTQIAWDDTVLPFQLDRSDIRGRVARLDGALDQVLSKHDYPPQIEALVAEATLLTALIGQTIKLRWKLSLQVRGSGAVKLIATDYYGPTDDGQPARIRAYAGYDAEQLSEGGSAYAQLGEGYFAILIDQGPGTVPYQGITPIAGGSLSSCAETYFAQSEQLPTRFALTCGRSQTPGEGESWRAGGVMLQHMPKASPFAADGGGSGEGGLLSHSDILAGDEDDNWIRANTLLDTVEDLELIGPQVAPTDLLIRLFHEEAPRVFDAQPVRFGCSCSEDRVRESLSIYSADDIAEMTTDEGILTADCQFCGAHYELDPQTLGADAAKAAEGVMTPEALHRALGRPSRPTSDFDLNPGTVLPPGRVLRPAAVLLAVWDRPGGARVLLTQRSARLKHHPGQIAFPGGKIDEGDAGPVGAALREAQEEIGLPPERVTVIGTMPAHETVTGYTVTPVVGHVTGDFIPQAEAGEVVEVFDVPFSHLLDPDCYRVERRQWRGTWRHYYTVPWGPYYIWGATARILRAFAGQVA